MPFTYAIAWPALVLVWILGPFVGGGTPKVLETLYWVFVVLAVVYGLVTAVKRKNIWLGICSVITLFAWPIELYLIISLFGFN